MDAIPAERGDRPALQVRADPTETRLVERALAVARLLISMAAVLVILLVPPGPSVDVALPETLLALYAIFASILLAALLAAKTIPPRLPLIVQTVDVAFAAALSLLPATTNDSFVTFLLYPLFAAAYRWGFREVMITAGVIESVMAAQTFLVGSSAVVDTFILRATSVAAAGAAVGYLAEHERRRRFEDRAISLVLGRIRLGGKLADTVNLVLALVRNALRATQVVLVLKEQSSGRVLLWPTQRSSSEPLIGRPEQVPLTRQDDYLFETPGAAWHATTGTVPRRRQRFDVVALDDLGRRLPPGKLSLPDGFLAAHPCTRLIGASLRLSDEWIGRVFVLGPGMGVHREQSARFALNLANRIAPAVYDHYLVRRLRTHAQALERGRIARELHDGVTQSLLGLEMEIVVMRRRAVAEAPRLLEDLARAHRIVRDEVVTVRELMEGIRVGDVESGDLLHHLNDLVDRFSRHTGLVARFVSDGRVAALTPYVRRHMAGIVHEALVNVRKHSGADHVMVRTDVQDAWWKLSIEDDGRGFTFAGRRSQEELDALRQGPRTIGERVRLINGVMTVESRPGFGARIEVDVPIQAVG
jgi:signal transduction histidine kinase